MKEHKEQGKHSVRVKMAWLSTKRPTPWHEVVAVFYGVVFISGRRRYNFRVCSRGSKRARGRVDIDRDSALFPARVSTCFLAYVCPLENTGSHIFFLSFLGDISRNKLIWSNFVTNRITIPMVIRDFSIY